MEYSIEETMKRKDYKLKYRFNYCRICEAKGLDPYKSTNIYVHDFDDSGHNINQYHGQLGTKDCHMEKPLKICTKCKKLYNYDAQTCGDCQSIVDERTNLELLIETNTKAISRNRRLKNSGKLSKDAADERIKYLESEKKTAEIKLGVIYNDQ